MQLYKKLADLSGRRRGFRVSLIDVGVIVACVVATWILLPTIGDVVWFLPFTVGHFFLFCNVFRVRRRLELLWAFAFVSNVALWQSLSSGGHWIGIMLTQLPITLGVIAYECRSREYHGIFSRT